MYQAAFRFNLGSSPRLDFLKQADIYQVLQKRCLSFVIDGLFEASLRHVYFDGKPLHEMNIIRQDNYVVFDYTS